MSVWFKSCLNPWYIWIPSNPNLYSTKIIMKMRWQTIASNVSIRIISSTATPLPKAYDCVAVYIAGRRTHLVVYLANLTGKLQTTFFQWKYFNSDWYHIEVCFKGIIYNKSALHCFVVLIEMSFQLL